MLQKSRDAGFIYLKASILNLYPFWTINFLLILPFLLIKSGPPSTKLITEEFEC